MKKFLGWILIIIGISNFILGHGVTPEVAALQFIVGCMILDKD